MAKELGYIKSNSKVLETIKLNLALKKSRDNNEIIGLCHGCFDVLHAGHIRYFEAARNLCDVLIVTITADKYVNKGKDRPVIHQHDRALLVGALSCVDYVSISYFSSAEVVIKNIQPALYFKGADYADTINNPNSAIYKEKVLVENFGGKCCLIDELRDSSSAIIERIRSS